MRSERSTSPPEREVSLHGIIPHAMTLSPNQYHFAVPGSTGIVSDEAASCLVSQVKLSLRSSILLGSTYLLFSRNLKHSHANIINAERQYVPLA